MPYKGFTAMPLLAAKLFNPPPRASMVSRPRLIERIKEGMFHNRRIFEKIQVCSRTEATARARELGLL